MVLAYLKVLLAFIVCCIALVLPYRARLLYGRALAWAAHAPFIFFGRLARRLLRQLEPEP